ncbi:MAG: DUF4349 domain-containing protein [Sphingobacteriaceae bacterium]|nr:MAG: DUF4349 domain-containing protein [Sphingobacteriaceae bacterium]
MKISNLIVLLTGAVVLYSCKGQGNPEGMDYASSDTALVAADSIEPTQPKLVKTADMSFKVKNVQQTCEQVSALTSQYQGMVTHHQLLSEILNNREIKLGNDSLLKVSSFTTQADMTLKLPTDKLEDFMNKVSHMGMYVTMRRMDIEDKSLDYLSSQLKLNSRNELVKQQKTGRITIKDPAEVLYFKDQLVDEQIYKRRVDDAVKYSVVCLNFYQSNTILKETIANDDPSDYDIPFFSRMGLALTNGVQLFAGAVVAITNLWVFILAGLGIWMAVRMYKKKSPVVLSGK